ncbi:MAG: serine/threonine protein kinase [Acidobacteria bacterium]|nr:serine/threonine protein kinase [Acidobacteriota bacterium]
MPRDDEKETGRETARVGADDPTAMMDRTLPLEPGADGGTLAMTLDDGEGLPRTFRPGELVAGRYRVARFIGRGGVGEVYEVEDEELHGRLALKTLRADTAGAEAVGRFKREIQLARRVTHPNICRIYDMGYHDFSPEPPGPGRRVAFLTMELLRGESLTDLVRRRGRLRTPEALPIIRELAAALDAAHATGIVHRDFKGANVILAEGPSGTRAVVTDFGLARTVEGADASLTFKTCQSSVLGTPAYISPEQLDGSPVTPAADLYALGVVIYEMVTGRLPFTGDTPVATMVKRLVEPPEPPRLHVPELDPLWESVLLRCLQKDPRRRFQRAGAVVEALEGRRPVPADADTEVIPRPGPPAAATVAARPAPGPRPPAPATGRRLPWRVILPVLALVLAGGAALVWIGGIAGNRGPEPAPVPPPALPPAPPAAAVPAPAPVTAATPAPPAAPAVSPGAAISPGAAASPAPVVPAPPVTAAETTPPPPPAADPAADAEAKAAEAGNALSAGRTAEAARLFGEAGDRFEKAGKKQRALQVRLNQAEADYRLGNLHAAYDRARLVLHAARAGAFPRERSGALLWQGWSLLSRGMLADAERAFAESLDAAPDGVAKAAARLGKAAVTVYRNRPDEAAAMAETLVGEFRRLNRPADEALAGALLAHARLQARKAEPARAAVDAATAAARGQDLYTRLSVMIIEAAVRGAAKLESVYLDRMDALMRRAAASGFVGLKLQAQLLKAYLALGMKQPLKALEALKGLESEALSRSFGLVTLQLAALREKALRAAPTENSPTDRTDPAPPGRVRPRPFRR